jgi:hypothetical protein
MTYISANRSKGSDLRAINGVIPHWEIGDNPRCREK